jgi:hypothetical protein
MLPLVQRVAAHGARVDGRTLLRPALPPLLSAALMAATVAAARWRLEAALSPELLLAACVATGVAVYAAAVRLGAPALVREAREVAVLAAPSRRARPR